SYIEGAIFEEVAKALRAQLKDPENGANVVEWQVRALQETGQLNDAVIKRLAAVTGVTEDVIRQAIYAAGADAIG
ncbi:phage minor capsid protein, partial [Salmonella enterica]|uniref:phage minor capsid protein n=1 Tax=Salmonella enterica TaxID=28901 RepID=UPI003CEF8A05